MSKKSDLKKLDRAFEQLNHALTRTPQNLDTDVAQSFYNMLSLILLDNVLKSMSPESANEFKQLLVDIWRQHVTEESIAYMTQSELASTSSDTYVNMISDSLDRVEPFIRAKLEPLGTYEDTTIEGEVK